MGSAGGRASALKRSGKGAKALWVFAHANYAGDDCLIWPFKRNPNGYGMLSYKAQLTWAHRFMCIVAHGEPPAGKTDAAHSCGHGNQGCVNPRHLSWKSKRENMLDQRQHGTARNAWWGAKGKLKPAEVISIRALKGKKTAIEIAKDYPHITANTVRTVLRGVTWKNVKIDQTKIVS
jgi:hypothetical protein